jgi:C4-dicarboxylate transporter DctQ subunit
MPEILQFLADWLNEGERYEKLPRFIPYMALPIGMALLTFRFVQITYQIATDQLDRLIAGHEAEEELEALKEELKDAGEAMEPNNKNSKEG